MFRSRIIKTTTISLTSLICILGAALALIDPTLTQADTQECSRPKTGK